MKHRHAFALTSVAMFFLATVFLVSGCGARKVQPPDLDTVRQALVGREIAIDDQPVTLTAENVSDLSFIESADTGRDRIAQARIKFNCAVGESKVEVVSTVYYKITPAKTTEVLDFDLAAPASNVAGQ